MLKDLHFKFIGFHGSDGACHIRLAKAEKDKPLIIVCSQYKNYYGTSVTNALELISEKLFYEIANNQIEGVSFDFKLPIYEKWHSDVNAFDRVLTKVLPNKYHHRFKDKLLDIVKIFKEIIWIEHYPEEVGLLQDTATVSIVSLNENGSPNWQHGMSKNVYEHLGFKPDDLFITGNDIDFERVRNYSESKTIQPSNASSKEIVEFETISSDNDISDFRQCRWINNLLDLLPSKLHIESSEIGDEDDSSLDEKYVHRNISQILALKMPAFDLFGRDYPISRNLEIYKKGREKECDFVIYKPHNKISHSLIEVKRTSELNSSLKTGVSQDIAKLVLCSQKMNCYTYLLVCGDSDIINSQLSILLGESITNTKKTFELSVSSLKFANKDLTSEYFGYLENFQIESVFIKNQGFSENNGSSVFIWEISHQSKLIGSQRPYEFQIVGPKEP